MCVCACVCREALPRQHANDPLVFNFLRGRHLNRQLPQAGVDNIRLGIRDGQFQVRLPHQRTHTRTTARTHDSTHARAHTHTHTRTHTHSFSHTNTQAPVSRAPAPPTHPHMHTHARARTHMHARTHTSRHQLQVCLRHWCLPHAHMHTCTHTRTHTLSLIQTCTRARTHT